MSSTDRRKDMQPNLQRFSSSQYANKPLQTSAIKPNKTSSNQPEPSISKVQSSNDRYLIDEDENLFELEIKNLDTNEIIKMQIPFSETDNTLSVNNPNNSTAIEDPKYASKRKTRAVSNYF